MTDFANKLINSAPRCRFPNAILEGKQSYILDFETGQIVHSISSEEEILYLVAHFPSNSEKTEYSFCDSLDSFSTYQKITAVYVVKVKKDRDQDFETVAIKTFMLCH